MLVYKLFFNHVGGQISVDFHNIFEDFPVATGRPLGYPGRPTVLLLASSSAEEVVVVVVVLVVVVVVVVIVFLEGSAELGTPEAFFWRVLPSSELPEAFFWRVLPSSELPEAFF